MSKHKKIILTQELIEQYFQERQESLSEDYTSAARYTLVKLLEIIDKKPIENITPAIISQYIRLRIENDSIVPRNLSRSSLKTKLRHVRSYLNWLLGKRHEFTLSFADYYDTIKTGKKTNRIVSEKTLKIIINNSRINYQFVFWLACKIGARRTALCDLNITNLNFTEFKNTKQYYYQERFIELTEIYGENSEACIIIFEDKFHGREARKEVAIPLYPVDSSKLREYLTIRNKKQKQMKKEFKDNNGEYLFWNKRGNRLDPESVSKHIWKTTKKLDIGFQMHDTRRLAINHWSFIGFDKEEIKVLSGHSSNAIDRYINADQKKVWGKLGKNQAR